MIFSTRRRRAWSEAQIKHMADVLDKVASAQVLFFLGQNFGLYTLNQNGHEVRDTVLSGVFIWGYT